MMRQGQGGKLALAVIAVPIAVKAARRISQSIQSRNQGSSPVSNVMHKAASGLDAASGRARQRGF